MLAGLKLVISPKAKITDIFTNSQLVVKQITDEFKVHNDKMILYLDRAQDIMKQFTSWRIANIRRCENQYADSLAKLTSLSLPSLGSLIYTEELSSPLIGTPIIQEISFSIDWRTPILDFILENKLPESKRETRSLIIISKNYCVINVIPYRRAFTAPLLRCISPN